VWIIIGMNDDENSGACDNGLLDLYATYNSDRIL